MSTISKNSILRLNKPNINLWKNNNDLKKTMISDHFSSITFVWKKQFINLILAYLSIFYNLKLAMDMQL